MWIFAPEGLLMPAAVPMTKVDPKWTEDGKFDFQIRGRAEEHLQNFIDAYMEPGTYNPEIQLTPEMDYNARFYTTREAFAAAMAKALVAIDYEKFKPTAYDHDRKVHPYYDTLNAIWGTVTRLGRPGGKWDTSRWRGGRSYSSTVPTYVGSTFGPSEDRAQSALPLWGEEAYFDRFQDDMDYDTRNSMPDYVPTVEDEMDDILDSLSDIPVEQWREHCDDHEWDLIKSIAAARIRTARKVRRTRRQTKPMHRASRR